MSNAQEYFNTAATTYRQRSERFPWAWIRRQETRAVDEALGTLTGFAVLDLGCGAGLYAGRAVAQGARRVVGVDLVPAMVANLPTGVEGVVADAGTLRLGETFDRIVSAGLLEFVPDPAAVFATIEAHLDGEGRAAVLFPVRVATVLIYQAFHLSHGVHIRLFDRNAVEGLAGNAGLRVISFRQAGPFAGVAGLARG